MAFLSVSSALPRAAAFSPAGARVALIGIVVAAAAVGLYATDPAATARAMTDAGAEWARLLRAMALLKALFAAAATGAVLWRLGAPVSRGRGLGYALGVAAAWSGPGLIWGLDHIALGALLLHGGLVALAVMVWRDPATSARLAQALASRRKPRDA